ncbi:MAG TPA: hypothetical protein VK815_17900 [Candidatus Acidoferrales bacterium]|jgi:hypothetical protein|nr:hypothetical protein [Candidatus Acidoferrales bacterium]
MKLRWLPFLLCAVFGLALLVGGLLVPAHLRALDGIVMQAAGRNGQSLAGEERALAGASRLGSAQLLLQASLSGKNAGDEPFKALLADRIRQNPGAFFWGAGMLPKNTFDNTFRPADFNSPFTDFVIREENREAALSQLRSSANVTVQELLRTRSLTQTVIFSPSPSPSGQAFDAAVVTCGLLSDGGCLMAGLNGNVLDAATQANHGNGTQPLESMLLDFMSLGQRLNWDQLATFVMHIPDAATLHRLADNVRNAGPKLPVLFAAVELSGKPAAVADYLAKFKDTGWADLGASLQYGAGGVGELVQHQQRLYEPKLARSVAAYNPFGGFYGTAAKFYYQEPALALAGKWFLYLLAGFFLALALHFARPAVAALERPLQVRGFHLFREFLFSLGFLLVVLLLSEPFLSQDSQKESFSLRLVLPMTGAAIPAGIAGIKQTVMNPTILLTLLVFFVLQALIYISCLVKLAEIRRQNVPARMKLKLLENEDHLFDAGLYLGFVGTIISLIVASMGLIKFSLMAAYSSTSFGIIFVVIFKIFHLRPARRKLLMEAEAQNSSAETYVPAAAPASTLPS